jgi:hypothetical protein
MGKSRQICDLEVYDDIPELAFSRFAIRGGSMYQSRRRLLTSFAGIAGGFTLLPALAATAPFQRDPQPMPSPNAPNPNYPPGLNNAGVRPDSENKKSVDPQVQKDIRDDVQKLFDLATELRDEVAKTDANSVFSISVVKKAQQIEKLAKKVKDLSKG